MKNDRLETIHLRFACAPDRRFPCAGGVCDARVIPLVLVHTDTGPVGIGSGYTHPGSPDEARPHVAKGFRRMKMRGGRNEEYDTASVRAVRNGRLPLRSAPGLGIERNRAVVGRYRLEGPFRIPSGFFSDMVFGSAPCKTAP